MLVGLFSDQFRKVIIRYKHNLNIMRQSVSNHCKGLDPVKHLKSPDIYYRLFQGSTSIVLWFLNDTCVYMVLSNMVN